MKSPLPGYTGFVPVLHDGEDFEGATFAGPQALRLIIDHVAPESVDSADFEILEGTTHEGYCGNGLSPEILGPSNRDDLSFLPEADARTHTVSLQDGRLWAPLHCKDYAAAARVRITLKKNGEPVGNAALVSVPHDANGDQLADRWQNREITSWNTQFAALRPVTEAERNAMQPNGEGVYPDTEEIDPDGADNGDGGRNLPAMATAGDGLTILDEYRGYLFDGGVGVTGFTHKRLSTARKELLVECSEATGIASPEYNGAGTNPAIAAYGFGGMMKSVSDFYRDPDRGAAIDLYWCRDSFEPLEDEYSYAAAPNIFYDAFFELGMAHYLPGSRTTTGGNTIHFEFKWHSENADLHNDAYGGSETSLLRHSRDDAGLRRFVKLFLGHRKAQIIADPVTTRRIRGATSELAATNEEGDHASRGSWIYISGLADERILQGGDPYSAAEFSAILDYTLAHELGHLIIDARNANGWDAFEHSGAGNGSIMRDPPIRTLGDSRFTDEEIGSIDLPARTSVLP